MLPWTSEVTIYLMLILLRRLGTRVYSVSDATDNAAMYSFIALSYRYRDNGEHQVARSAAWSYVYAS